ncbi:MULTISPECIES: MFS transporter [Fusobacterium]|uniref:MFS transporter n=1 Tax=Fusobacterium TaxID=848 RepID=UPI00147712C3|nr:MULTISPECIES: MFS transporter [Fusobacterium]NME36539.1 MFS transporter [Fusobacterium sp. FSA-380-WT-3A]
MKLNKKVQVLYGIGVSYAIVDQIFAQWLIYFYLPTESSGLKPILTPTLLSIALAISRVVDMITDPTIGYLSDKINTRWGRRIPFIAIGSIPLGITTIAFFYPPISSQMSSFIYLSIVGSLFFTFYTIVGAPYNALIPEIGNSMEERLGLSTWQSVFRLIYTAIAMVLPGVIIEKLGNGNSLVGIRYMVIIFSIISIIGGFITVFGVKEKDYSKGEVSKISFKETIDSIKSYKSFYYYLFGLLFFFIGFNTLRATMNYYVEDIMGYGKFQITIASAILFGMSALFFYPTNIISKKIGYRKVMLGCLGLLIIFTGMLFLIGKVIPPSSGFIIFALLGIPIAGGAFIFPPAMLSEISNKISEKTGNKIEGICFGIQGFFLKLAFMLSVLVLPHILALNTQGNESVTKYGIYMTAIFSLVSFIISGYFYYKYEE